jgi:redox-sensitive bicupin YhaK (pirin superfamily)
MPDEALRREGGPMHGFQLWVNLPREHKMKAPRYQEVPSDRIPTGRSDDGKVTVKVIAGRSMGEQAVIDTHLPITYLHFEVAPGGEVVQPLERSLAAFAYVFRGGGEVGGQAVTDGQMAVLRHDRDEVRLAVASDADEAMELLLIAGQPLREPVARYGPFVMNTREEILEAVRDFQSGRMGAIDF